MTLFGIDISHHQAGIDLQRVKNEGFEFVIARVGQGRGGAYGTTRDREWVRHRDEARRVGLRLCAYWYIGNGLNARDNARLCADWMDGDTSIPVALDCENGSGNIDFFRSIMWEFRNFGFRVPLSYIPKWYWQSLGSPTLTGIPPLWSSRYVVGTGTASQLYPGDNSSHWTGYGNNSIAVAQFTSSAKVANYTVDANAFRGSLQELDQLLYGIPITPPPPPNPPVEVDMQLDDVVGHRDGKPFTVRDVFTKEYFTDLSKVDALYDLVINLHHELPTELQEKFKGQFTKISDLIYTLQGKETWEDKQNQGTTWGQMGGQKWGSS